MKFIIIIFPSSLHLWYGRKDKKDLAHLWTIFPKHIGFLSRLTPYFLAYKGYFYQVLDFLLVLITPKLFYTVLYTL